MVNIFLCNAFSLSMLDREVQAGKSYISYPRTPRPISLGVVQQWLNLAKQGKVTIKSAIGHADTAGLLSALLDYPIAANRISVKIRSNDDLIIVAQYAGPRLPEGCTTLPDGASFEFWAI